MQHDIIYIFYDYDILWFVFEFSQGITIFCEKVLKKGVKYATNKDTLWLHEFDLKTSKTTFKIKKEFFEKHKIFYSLYVLFE